jgi:cytochrome c5
MSNQVRAIVGGFAGALLCAALFQPARFSTDVHAAGAQTQPAAPAAPAASPQRALLDKYCVTCHNQKLLTAGLALDKADVTNVPAGAQVWEKVVRKLGTRAMPPLGMPRPDKPTYDAFASWLENELDRAAAARPNPGRVGVRRLNQFEYTNAVRDLLGLEIDGRALLPSDESSDGFDNIAEALSVSPVLLERYMIAAHKIGAQALADPKMRPGVATYRIPALLVQDERMSDDLPIGSRGGTAIRHYFPLDGEYVVKVRLLRAFNAATIRGLEIREQLDVRLDGVRLKLFSVGGDCPPGAKEPKCAVGPDGDGNLSLYSRTADEELDIRFPATAGTHVVGVSFVKRMSAEPQSPTPIRLPATQSEDREQARADQSVDTIQIEGPFNATGPGDTASRREILACRPSSRQDEEPCARKILARLARRAYRRPVTDLDVQRLVGFYRTGRSAGDFEAGIRLALERLLVSPSFLFRAEPDPSNVAPGTAYRLSDLELASRLSFFLWSSIPDDELLDVAVRGRLKDPKIAEQQVRRMLRDPKSTALVKNFGGQWLLLRNIRLVTPDADMFPEFDDKLREGFQRETELFLESQFREDRGVLELLTANYTFLNERLARIYGIPNVYGSHFRRVTLPDDRRAGLLGHGSILTVTSYPTRTSPVLRGKWVMETLLASPPPLPPANVPPLKENDGASAPTSVRERLEQHRKNPVCASCHTNMDPLGFAFENFDAVGKWRVREANTRIDASGALADGTKFSTPAEFRQALLSQGEVFVGALTEKMMTYALGRAAGYTDMPAIRTIKREAAANGYRWSSIILGITKSVPFQMRTTAGPQDPVTSTIPPRTAERVEKP